MTRRGTMLVFAGTLLLAAAAARGQVVIDMPPPVPAAADRPETLLRGDVGALAMARYAGARTAPRDFYVSPGPAWWWYRRVGVFPCGYRYPFAFFPCGYGFWPTCGFGPYGHARVVVASR